MQGRFVHRALHLVVPVFLALAAVASLHAQDAASPKFTLFAGAGILAAQGRSQGEVQAGASFEEAPPNVWAGISFEGGYLGPWSRPGAGSGFLSVDYMASWHFGQKGSGRLPNGTRYWSDRGWRLLPFASAGYTRLFGTANAVNFGGGIDYRLSNTRAIRVEVRDYYAFSTPAQHNIALRIGWVIYLAD